MLVKKKVRYTFSALLCCIRALHMPKFRERDFSCWECVLNAHLRMTHTALPNLLGKERTQYPFSAVAPISYIT
jgi:hypothetical protein